MRSIAVLTMLALASAFFVVRELPENEADAETSHATRPQEIQSVGLDGRNLPTSALREVLSTRAGDLLDATRLDHDRVALETTMTARGYLAAKVAAAAVEFDSSGGAFVTFAIVPGPLFHVRSVELVGAADRDAGVVTIAQGQIVMADRLEHARDALAERLLARGKQGSVTVELKPDLATATVDVILAAR